MTRQRRFGARSYWPEKYPVLGLDVSHWDDKIDWNAVAGWKNADGNGVAFAFIKATDGRSSDDTFHRNWALAASSQAHQSAAIEAQLGVQLAAAGFAVTPAEIAADLASIWTDGTYPYIDGGMGAVAELAAYVLVHALHAHGSFADLIAAVVAKHGGQDKLNDEMAKALDAGRSIENRLLQEIAAEAVTAAAAADRPALKTRFNRLVTAHRDSGISYYETPRGPDAGILRGPYHFFHPLTDATDQAQSFFDTVAASGGLRDEDLPPAIDVETDDGMTSQSDIADRLERHLQAVERLFGRTPIIYASPGQWATYIAAADNPRFARYPLWAARYDRDDKNAASLDPTKAGAVAMAWQDPPSWPSYAASWTFWQHRITPSNDIAGVAGGRIDCDVFNGDRAALQALTNRPAGAQALSARRALGRPRPSVVLDPGHGGAPAFGGSSAFGVRGPSGTLEKDVTLLLARSVAASLNGAGAGAVVLTRSGDENPGLRQRAAVARAHGAPVFLSLHADERGAGGPSGSELWLHPEGGPRSLDLARRLQRALADRGLPQRGIQVADMGVLRPAALGDGTAACLLEIDRLADPAGERRLRDPATLARLGRAIADGVRAFLDATAG